MTTTPAGDVRRAHAAWLLAATVGVYESGLAIAHGFAVHDLTVPGLLGQLTVRTLVLAGVIVAAQRMRDGSNTARRALALVGVIGIGSFLVGPTAWLADGHGPADLDLAPLEWVLASSQALVAAAVLVAIAWMFTARSRAWYAARPDGASSAPAAMIGAAR
jgi:hypothetical protein